MPATRGEKKRREQYLHSPPAPAMSQSHVSFSVLEPFRNQSDTNPISSSAAVRECLDHVASSVGETINANAIFSVAASALPTGAYGQEACFTLNPTQRNTSGYTIGSIIRAAKEVEGTIWNTEEGRLRHKESITRVKAIYNPEAEETIWKLQEKRLKEIQGALQELKVSKELMRRKLHQLATETQVKMEIDQQDPVIPPRRLQAPPPPAYSFQNPSPPPQTSPLLPTMPEADRHWCPGQEQAQKEINAMLIEKGEINGEKRDERMVCQP